jgi:hypothetical protein
MMEERFSATKFRLQHLCQNPDLSKLFKLICAVQSPSEKFFALPVGQIISTSPRHPVSQEGRLAIVTDVETGCGGRRRCFDESANLADGEVVWS